jgi:hypothetical protein
MERFIERIDNYIALKVEAMRPDRQLTATEQQRSDQAVQLRQRELLNALDQYTDERIMNALRSLGVYNGDETPVPRQLPEGMP